MVPISVIIPTHNRAALLDKTLHSLTCQSRMDFHIVLVDHGSTDDTAGIYQKYKDSLPISYYTIPRNGYAPAIARDFGAKKSEAPLLVFLDCGTVVPVRFVEAHLAFHSRHVNSVGIGLRHGYRDWEDRAEYMLESAESYGDLASLLGQQGRDQAEDEISLRDGRADIDLEHSSMPWYFGWTANLSFEKERYLATGGFNMELTGWGYEDLDLCYRLFKQGMKFAYVEDGWCIELPQSRPPARKRLESNRRNTFRCYREQRTLALEALLLPVELLRKALASYRAATSEEAVFAILGQIRTKFLDSQHVEECFRYLTMIGQERVACPPIPEHVRSQFTRPTLLIGGTEQDAGDYDYLTLADESYSPTPSVWSCSGILIPLADQSLGTVIIADVWKKFGWPFAYSFPLPALSLLEYLILEIQRTARKAIFLDSQTGSPDSADISVETLKGLCGKYNLPFEIVSLSLPVGA